MVQVELLPEFQGYYLFTTQACAEETSTVSMLSGFADVVSWPSRHRTGALDSWDSLRPLGVKWSFQVRAMVKTWHSQLSLCLVCSVWSGIEFCS